MRKTELQSRLADCSATGQAKCLVEPRGAEHSVRLGITDQQMLSK
jgi:hypothetical protein